VIKARLYARVPNMASNALDESKIKDLLTRGVGDFIDPDGSFVKKLKENPEKIVIKFGVDPTRPDIHLGHAVVLRKLRQFQDLGCKVIFLVGDFTALIGDPTGKSKLRPEIAQEEVMANMETYLQQVGKILSTTPNVFSWIRNSDWFVSINDIVAPENRTITIDGITLPGLPGDHILNKADFWVETRMQKGRVQNYSFINVLALLRTMTLSRLIERDMFQERLKNNEPIFMHEMLYPVIQGIDSNVLANIYGSCDLEVGGTDQHFNMLVGRDVMEVNKKEPQAVLSFKLLEGLDGKQKMSKSLENYVSIIDVPSDMYGKILSLPDASIVNYFELCTYTPIDQIKEIEKNLSEGKVNPKDVKMELARQIVSEYHGEQKAKEAEQDWVTKFEKNEIPEVVDEIKGEGLLMPILVEAGIIESNSEARRLFESGAISDMTSGSKVTLKDEASSGHIYKIGKHRFIKIV
jgi:tyrosyl-tRNA synthetase